MKNFSNPLCNRATHYRCAGIFSLILLILLSMPALGLERIVLSVPGPRSFSYLPFDLIPKIHTDHDEGIHLQIIYTGSGAVALKNLLTHNADFAVAGAPAVMSLRANNGDVVIIAPINNAPLFVLMVRSTLQGQVKRIADLKGKVIGVTISTSSSKTTSQQLAELLLQSDGVALDEVRIVPSGQSWVEQSSLIISGAADAIMGSEPFASRLQREGLVFFLANLADSTPLQKIKGSHFLHAALVTRNEFIAQAPEKVATMVRIIKKTLTWIATHSPEQIVNTLEVNNVKESASLLFALKQYPNAFSRDGRFSTIQLQETDDFFHAAEKNFQNLPIENIIDDRWAGRNP